MEVRDVFQQSDALLGPTPRISLIVEVSLMFTVVMILSLSLQVIVHRSRDSP